MIKTIKLSLLLLFSLLLSSCIQAQEIEKIGIINARGMDVEKEGLFKTTLIVFQFSTQAKEITRVITGEGKTVGGAMEDAEHASVFKLVPGKIKLSLYGREMAEQGILSLMDTQARDARIPDLMYLAVSTTTANEMLSIDEKKIPVDVGKFLHGIIENHSTDHNIPRKTLQDFLRIYYDVGQDNVLPLFEIKDEVPKHSGSALFQGDKMIGELKNEETLLINLMDRIVRKQAIEVILPLEPFESYLENREYRDKDAKFVFEIKNGRSKTKLVDDDKLLFETNTKIIMRLTEQSAGIFLKEKKVTELIEKEVQKEIENRFEKLLAKLQELGVDPFGYGRYYNSSPKGKDLTRKEWREKLPTIQVKFNVEVDLVGHGVTD